LEINSSCIEAIANIVKSLLGSSHC